jgi:hypothetical protein
MAVLMPITSFSVVLFLIIATYFLAVKKNRQINWFYAGEPIYKSYGINT